MEKVFYNEKPERIKYMKKPNGLADAWLRANIELDVSYGDDGEQYSQWQADEQVLHDTELSKAEIEADFFSLFVDAPGVQAALTKAVQNYMDATVQARGYDGIATACTYATSTDETFAKEGTACVAWRDKVWRHCYDTLAEVLAGQRDIPTAEELIAELPKLEW